MTMPYYEDDLVTLYHGDCRELTHWLAADVLVTDPPYGSQGLSNGYGRRVKTIANDLTTEARDEALELWGDRPTMCFGTPKLPDPPGQWRERLVWDKREPGLGAGAWRYNHETIFVRGDGWVRAAAKYLGRKIVGVELDERYCELAAMRCAQDTLFGGAA